MTDAKPPVTDRTMRPATKGLPIINGEPVRLRDTLYRDGKPYRVFRMLDDSKGKVYAIEFEGFEKPVTLKELKAFSRKLRPLLPHPKPKPHLSLPSWLRRCKARPQAPAQEAEGRTCRARPKKLLPRKRPRNRRLPSPNPRRFQQQPRRRF